MKKIVQLFIIVWIGLVIIVYQSRTVLLTQMGYGSYAEPTTKDLSRNPLENLSDNNETKVVLFWKTWNDQKVDIDSDKLKRLKCPTWNCDFIYDREKIKEADAVLFFRFAGIKSTNELHLGHSNQRWIVIDREAVPNSRSLENIRYVNWTMTFHSSADVVGSYGFFIDKDASFSSLRPNLMDYDSPTMKRYLDSLRRNHTSDIAFGSPNDQSQPRSKLAFWVSSHCQTKSKREKFIRQVQKYQEIDTYGSCGRLKCGGRRSSHTECWETLFSANYLFNFAMENVLCEEYITEKVYLPLKYGVVPIVFGGADYDRFLPPHSYINAMDHTPKELVKLLLKLREDPHEYARYHLWRKFWDVYNGINYCELCHKLHLDETQKSYSNFYEWRKKSEKCSKRGRY